jgi:hypothetical protein
MISCIVYTGGVLNPKVGNPNEIHDFLIDLLYITHPNRGSRVQLDVMDYLWNEIWLVLYYRKRPPFAPYVIKFLYQKWSDKGLGDLLESDVGIMGHPVKELKRKVHFPPKYGPGSATVEGEVEAEDSSEDSEYAPPESMGWVDRIESKLKKLFCFNEFTQKKYVQGALQ